MDRTLFRHIIFFLTLAMLTVAGEAWAQQTTGQFVIKTGTGNNTHYLSHAGNALGDAISFSPNVLWTSDNKYTQGGANRNYYFMEGNTPHFLAAPNFEPFGELSLSPSLPLGNQLSNPESQYYFYRWDNGLGRGVQYYGVDSTYCVDTLLHGWDERSDECWEVYWVAYNDTVSPKRWTLSQESYGITTTGGRFYPVTITEHGIDTTILMVTVGEVQVPSGLQALQGFEMEYSADPLSTHQVNPTVYDYQYAVRPAYTTYVFDGGTHNYYDAGSGAADQGESTPASVNSSVNQVANATYAWTLSGPGATYLTIDNATSANPTITYSTPNNTGHKTATLTLTVTYGDDGPKQSTSANILVKTPCQNPPVQDENATVTFVGATVSWDPTATSYLVSWRVYDPDNSSSWNSHEVGDVTSYTITGLEYETKYEYKVKATSCSTAEPEGPYPTFTTLEEPGLMITGAIFGGGRMADVHGKTDVIVINFDSIGTVYGGNDIAGSVLGADGSTITLGVNSGDTYASYGTTTATVGAPLWLGSVYGGGNGYYTYDGNEPGVEVGTTVLTDGQFHSSATEVGGDDSYATSGTIPSITKTAITVTDDYVKVDSIFGGARNAFVTLDDASQNGSTITINGGTIFSVFGGNNIGGSQKKGKHYIEVNKTTVNLASNIVNGDDTGYGRNFGIRYLFGGGNKAKGSSTDILIKGGQLDTVFAGGNSADVYYANVTVECSLGAIPTGSSYTFGNTYSNAINPSNYSQGTIGENTLYTNYGWDGVNGIYNVRTLYGGNNEAEMQRVPNITLTSGSVGTVYGGGNAGDMMGSASTTINGHNVLYGTHLELNSDKILVDYIYGGCRMSNVFNSTWVELKKGHVGYVYGGCNISGDVGSTRVNPNAPDVPVTLDDQRVLGATYVQAGAGGSNTDLIVYKDLFAGSNGYYHCTSDGIHYNADNLFGTPSTLYAGKDIPTHNETNVIVSNGVTVKGNVYAGGNLAPVGFDDRTGFYRGYPELVGMASVFMTGGRVEQNVYGGGNMASIYGRNEVKVSGGTILLGLYGGNDRAGQVAEKTNRKLPTGYGYTVASDNATSLTTGVMTFVGVSGNAQIGTVYGGGNGDYTYGGEGGIPYCGETPSHPIQPFTFVDINLNGGTSGGKIQTVYGGGNGVTVRGGAIVFVNIEEPNPAEDYDNVDTIFGGNNKGDLVVVPDIRLVHGQVGTVYGGCNRGAMVADENVSGINYLQTIGGYENIGSYVRLRNTYNPTNPAGTGGNVNVTAKVTEAVYGGCRMNGVTRNSLVLVEGGDFTAIPIFGGSDISGTVSGFSRVAVTGGNAIVGDAFGGGNGYYTYASNGNVYTIPTSGDPVLVATGITDTPNSVQSGVDMTNGTAANLYASGNACGSGATLSNISGGTVTSGIYGGSNAKGTVTGDIVVNVTGGLVGATTSAPANIHGGGYGAETQTGGNVLVNIGNVGAASAAVTPTIYGEIYGGSALGSVNTNSENTTTVNFLNGTLHGNVFGGGLGDATLNPNGYININETLTEAIVNGTVHVNIGDDSQTTYSKYLNIDGKVFGGNNLAGSPKGNIFVDVYRTAHTNDNTCPTAVPNPFPDNASSYALSEVYGGGNLAHYAPTLENASANVHVHSCDNTIRYVYGGGNAANVPMANVTIDGGLIEYVFGGGNGAGTGNPGANVNGNNTIALNGGMMGYVFGGSNTKGFVTGETSLAFAETPNCSPRSVNELYGGGNQAADENGITLNVPCGTAGVKTIYGGAKNADVGTEEIPASIILNVRGGDSDLDAVFGGNNQGGTIWGTVTLNLYGGTINNAFGGNNAGGLIKGAIQVNMEDMGGPCALGINTIYGGGNDAAYSPTDALSDYPEVNIKHGTVNNAVYGGGKGSTATVTANPKVVIGDTNPDHYAIVGALLNGSTTEQGLGYVFGGGDAAAVVGNTTVVYQDANTLSQVKQIFGGGNNIEADGSGVTNATVQMTNGKIVTGIYGGCNTDGDVTGNSVVTITGGTIGATGAGNGGAIFGGGYGHLTEVKGNVTVTFGDLNAPQSLSPILYGDLYGGSALGNVNTNATNNTTVNVYNGEITGPVIDPNHPEENTYGNVYGGGLGDASHAALVRGEVYVNIGATASPPSGMLSGKATLINCNVFGCNNVNGSPQDNVYVNVYQTAHIQGTNTVDDNEFAIFQVFGGGNRANYAPENNNENSEKKAHVYIHACENTVRYVFGGGNAADAVGVVTLVGGGHFDEIFGGGNGAFGAANIGKGGIGLNVMGGRVSYLYAGSNKHGICEGPNYEAVPLPGFIDCGELIVESFFFGDNEAEHYGDIVHTILCDDADNYHYTRLYAGSRWAIVYGDIKLTVCGGFIQSLFGGSMGYAINQIPAHVRMFPSWQEIHDDLEAHPSGADTLNRKYSYDLRKFMNYVDPDTNPSQYKTNLVGKGGNIELIITGGTIGEAIGGCDELGNVEGKITVIVDDAEDPRCPLRIGNVYGASDYTYYEPCDYEYSGNQVYYDPTGAHGDDVTPTPQVEIIHVKEATGVAFDFNGNSTTGAAETFAGNIYGGANRGDITSNPRVTIGDGTTGTSATKVTIGGDVYGGGNIGHVIGSPDVVVVPNTHSLTFNNPSTGGTFTVSYPRSSTHVSSSVSSGAAIGEGISLRLEATPTAPQGSTGYVFDHWEVNGTGACVNNRTSASTLFTMGSADASVSATFAEKTARTLNIASADGTGAYTVDGTTYSAPVYVVETASVTVHVTPADGYAFDHWEVSGTGATLSSTKLTTTVFTMGTTDATLTAYFKEAHLLSLVQAAGQSEYGSFKINGVDTTSIYLAQNEVATVVAIPTAAVANGNGYLFDHWTVSGGTGSTLSSTSLPSVTFKMGTAEATLTATFNQVQAHELTMQAVVGETTDIGGSFKVDGNNYTAPVWIAEGASVPIVATPANGYKFKRWIDTNAHGTIGDINAAYTVFIMGEGTTHTVQAEFEAIATHTFNFAVYPTGGGSITVTNNDGDPVSSGDQIREYARLNIVASPHEGYMFAGWTIDETGANAGAHVDDATLYETYFIMGTDNTTLTANFVPARSLTLSVDGTGTGSFKVNNVVYSDPVLIPVGSTVTIEAVPAQGSTFSGWTVVHPVGLELNNNTFTLPEADTEIKGTFNHR